MQSGPPTRFPFLLCFTVDVDKLPKESFFPITNTFQAQLVLAGDHLAIREKLHPVTCDNLMVSSTRVKAVRRTHFVPSNRNNTNIERLIWLNSRRGNSSPKDGVTTAVENLVKVSTFYTFQHPHTMNNGLGKK